MPPTSYVFDSEHAGEPLDLDAEIVEPDWEAKRRNLAARAFTEERVAAIAAYLRRVREATDRAVFLNGWQSAIGFPGGMAAFSMLCLLHPEWVRELHRMEADHMARQAEVLLPAIRDSVDVIMLAADDQGTQNGPILPPAVFRDLYVPAYRRITDACHRAAPGVKLFLHSCGAIHDLLPEVIAAGFDVLNPVQWSAGGRSWKEWKDACRGRIALWGGGVNTQRTLPLGNLADVERETAGGGVGSFGGWGVRVRRHPQHPRRNRPAQGRGDVSDRLGRDAPGTPGRSTFMSRNRRLRSMVFAALAAGVLAVAVPAAAQQAEDRIVEAIGVFSALEDLPDREVPSIMVKDAWGVAVFPNLRKYGFVVGLQRGEGVLLARTKAGGWGLPLFVSLSGGTVGWQVGVQSVDLVLFFLTPESVARALEGKLTLGVDVGVAAGGFGRQAGAGTDPDLRAEIVSYARSRGFFAGATIGSASIDADDEANAAFYGVAGIRAADILAGKVRALPPSAAALRKAIEDRAAR